MKRYFILFKGVVQGVGFRWRMLNIGQSLGVTGFAKNLSDGSVQVEVQGKQASIDAFLKQVLNMQGFVNIEDYAMKEIPLVEDDNIFTVRY